MAKKAKIAWKRVIPLSVLGVLVIYLVLSLLVSLIFRPGSGTDPGKKNNDPSKVTICTLNSKQTTKALEKENRENVVEVKDYNFYGESLNLYYDVYSRQTYKSNSLSGEKIALIDMCSDNKITFDISSDVDSQINIGKLTPGFYSVYIQAGEEGAETYTRVFASHAITSNNIIYSVLRNGERLRVQIVADKTYFDGEKDTESKLDKAYMYLNVTSEKANEATSTDYDICVATAPALTMSGVSLVGESANGIVEAEELYAVAQQIVSQLNEKGYRVKMLKDAYDQNILYYGTNGIAHKAYNSKAKYMIYLDMTNYDADMGVKYSGYAGGSLATSVYDKLVSIGLYDGNRTTELYPCVREEGNDPAKGEFDVEYEIRELGGIVTGAGQYSETSEMNASFASKNIYGVNTVKIVTTNIWDSSSVSRWNERKEAIANAIIEGLEAYLNN